MKKTMFVLLMLFVILSVFASGYQNPAAQECKSGGGTYDIQKDDAGNEYGICIAIDGKKTDEWELYRNKKNSDYKSTIMAKSVAAVKDAEKFDLTRGLPQYISDAKKETAFSSFIETQFSPDMDWRNYNGKNYVTPVKTQGVCGACWAFSTMGMAEARVNINLNNESYDINLAEQELISCSGAGDCSGGNEGSALSHISTSGTLRESCFPYTESNNACTNKCSSWNNELVKLNYNTLAADPNSIKEAIANQGPVIAYMLVCGDFAAYAPGVYAHAGDVYWDSSCVTNGVPNWHSILIIGYSDSGQYWIGKNSWGSGWGDAGYFKIAYSQSIYNSAEWAYNVEYTPEGDSRVFFLDASYAAGTTDIDNDGIVDGTDNCPDDMNTGQLNTDGDSGGDVCDTDDDQDGILDGEDNCPLTSNTDQADADNDGIGDVCDSCNMFDNDNDTYFNYQGAGCIIVNPDCNDNATAINSNATDICDSIDNNCNGQTDELFNTGASCQSGANICGSFNAGVFICTADGQGTECDVQVPPEPSNLSNLCSSTVNACGMANTGIILCDGSCSVTEPANPAGYGNVCSSSANFCGETSSGTIQCDGSCDAIIPADPENLSVACVSAANACGQTSVGTISCDGSCNAIIPMNPPSYGNACASSSNSCGDSSQGTILCDGSCSAITPAERVQWNLTCNSQSNSCGDTNTGLTDCSGVCQAQTPVERLDYGVQCNSEANTCGQTAMGVFVCDFQSGVVCNAITPANPTNYTNICTSAPSACGLTSQGTILCDGSCSATTPLDSANLSMSCESAPNACGITGAGAILCDGSCSATIPSVPQEVCDGTDNDCDGQTDEDGVCIAQDYYCDVDVDSFASVMISGTCDSFNCAPLGCQLTAGNDCNDNDGLINPYAAELCDSVDNNCAGGIDEGIAPINMGQNGVCSSNVLVCEGGIFINSTENTVPSAELCDNLDNDCNDVIDENLVMNASQLGICSANTMTCVYGIWADNNETMPASEICDGIDNDCDGQIDDGVMTRYYNDSDNDGFGNAQLFIEACAQPFGLVLNNTDCDDTSAGINPFAEESNDGFDNNCNVVSDEGYLVPFGQTGYDTWIGNSTESTIRYSGLEHISIYDNSTNTIDIEFDWNAAESMLNLSTGSVVKEGLNATSGYILVKGLALSAPKTIYINHISGNSVCVKDTDVSLISEITASCTGPDETILFCDGVTRGAYTCASINNGTRYKIDGLNHSAAIDFNYVAPSGGSGGSAGGGGGGSGGSSTISFGSSGGGGGSSLGSNPEETEMYLIRSCARLGQTISFYIKGNQKHTIVLKSLENGIAGFIADTGISASVSNTSGDIIDIDLNGIDDVKLKPESVGSEKACVWVYELKEFVEKPIIKEEPEFAEQPISNQESPVIETEEISVASTGESLTGLAIFDGFKQKPDLFVGIFASGIMAALIIFGAYSFFHGSEEKKSKKSKRK